MDTGTFLSASASHLRTIPGATGHPTSSVCFGTNRRSRQMFVDVRLCKTHQRPINTSAQTDLRCCVWSHEDTTLTTPRGLVTSAKRRQVTYGRPRVGLSCQRNAVKIQPLSENRPFCSGNYHLINQKCIPH